MFSQINESCQICQYAEFFEQTKDTNKQEEEEEQQQQQEQEEEEKEEFEEMDIKLTPKQAVATFRDSPFLFFYGGCYDNLSATNVDV